MLFKVESRGNGRSTHCGVLEFSADEGMVYMPYWVCPACTLQHRPSFARLL
jgi:ubiquitin fusion degradation protein 1